MHNKHLICVLMICTSHCPQVIKITVGEEEPYSPQRAKTNRRDKAGRGIMETVTRHNSCSRVALICCVILVRGTGVCMCILVIALEVSEQVLPSYLHESILMSQLLSVLQE